jgi:hypothetical protein
MTRPWVERTVTLLASKFKDFRLEKLGNKIIHSFDLWPC